MWKFEPILKTTIWGGDRIAPFKGITTTQDCVGGSWEISGVEGDESVVADGPDKGLKLPELLDKYGAAIMGERNYKKFGNRFPLLIKFIDARQDLSVQVHPDDAMAQRHGQSNGKTEMWYVIDAAPGARLANGFKEPVNPADYDHLVETGDIEKVLNFCDIKPGDVYFIPARRVHAIGAGAFVAEIQQTSDATYRLYDYHRKDAQGHERQLHTALAKEAINFNDTDGYAVNYTPRPDIPVNVVRCPFFTTNVLELDQEVMRDYKELDSFVVLIVTGGSGTFTCGADAVSDVPTEFKVRRGDTVLLSASAKGLTINPSADGLKLIETYVG